MQRAECRSVSVGPKLWCQTGHAGNGEIEINEAVQFRVPTISLGNDELGVCYIHAPPWKGELEVLSKVCKYRTTVRNDSGDLLHVQIWATQTRAAFKEKRASKSRYFIHRRRSTPQDSYTTAYYGTVLFSSFCFSWRLPTWLGRAFPFGIKCQARGVTHRWHTFWTPFFLTL